MLEVAVVGRMPIERTNDGVVIARHIDFLIRRNYGDREIAKMVSQLNGYKISYKLVGRYRKRHDKDKVPAKTVQLRPTPLKEIGSRCPQCKSQNLIIDREVGEVACTSCGEVIVELRHRGISIGQQVVSMAPERPLGESNGLGTYISFQDLMKLNLKHVSWLVSASITDKKESPEVRVMRRFASRIIEELPGMTSKTSEVAKARKAQITKITKELILIVYKQLRKEFDASPVLTDIVLKVNWKKFVPGILDRVLSDYFPKEHRTVTCFRKKYAVNQELRTKIDQLLLQELNSGLSSLKPLVTGIIPEESHSQSHRTLAPIATAETA